MAPSETNTTATMANVSSQDIISSCGVEDTCLDREVTKEHFYELSHYLTQWKLLAPNMNISQDEVETIEREHTTVEMQRIIFLNTWKQKMSSKATYRALMDALLSIGRAEDARGVCKTLTGM